MLSYRHAFHAGNHADVLKHATLSLLIASFRQKDKPFIYLDTHSGSGLYDLKGDWAQKTGEYTGGIAKLWQQPARWPELNDYFRVIAAHNPDKTLRYYPGSPELARSLLREQDKLALMELHSNESELLKNNLGFDRRVTVHQRDGLEGLVALLPPTPRRGFALIDPAYEQVEEYKQVPKALEKALSRWATGTFAIWYPLLAKGRDQSTSLVRRLSELPCKNLLVAELCIDSQQPEFGMHGSGLAIINAPWQLDEQLKGLLPRLCETFKVSDYASWKVEWRVKDE